MQKILVVVGCLAVVGTILAANIAHPSWALGMAILAVIVWLFWGYGVYRETGRRTWLWWVVSATVFLVPLLFGAYLVWFAPR